MDAVRHNYDLDEWDSKYITARNSLLRNQSLAVVHQWPNQLPWIRMFVFVFIACSVSCKSDFWDYTYHEHSTNFCLCTGSASRIGSGTTTAITPGQG